MVSFPGARTDRGDLPFRTDTVQDRVTVDMGLSVTVEEGYRYIIVGA